MTYSFQNLISPSTHRPLIADQVSTFQFKYFPGYLADKIFTNDNNSRRGDNSDNIKIRLSYFFMRNPFMKFQDSNSHGSKVIVCIKP